MDVISLYGPLVELEGWLYMQPPGFNAEEELGTDIVEKLRSGKGEKKRYFVLVRAKVPMKDQQAATLSWYQHKPEAFKKRKPQGSITFVPSHSVRLVDNILIELYTGARTYYFRPTADPNSAEARTCAGQWLSALDFALSKLLDGGKTLYNKNPLKVHRTLEKNKSSRNRGPVPSVLTDSIHVPGSQSSRTSFESLELGVEKTSGFYTLWKVNGIDGYNALMANFGPVLTDLERLRTHIECRYAQITEHCSVLEKNRIQVNEPILIVQKTTRAALTAVYNDNRQRLEVIAPVAVQIQSEVLQPLSKLIADIRDELENVVRFYGKYTQKLERTRKAVILATKEVAEKETQYYEAQQVATSIKKNNLGGKIGNNNLAYSATGKSKKAPSGMGSLKALGGGAKKFQRKVSFKFGGRGGSKEPAVATTSLSEYQDALANAKKNRVDQENELDMIEKKVGKNMKAAMDKLQHLEEGIMMQTKTILGKLIEFESKMFSVLAENLEAGGDIEQRVANIRPEDDMKMTTDYLLKAAKKNTTV